MQEFLSSIGVNLNVAFHLIFMGLIWMRILAMASVVPFLFGKPVPRSVIVGMSLTCAFFAYTALVPESPPDMERQLFPVVALFVKEALIGLLIGLAVSVIFYGFQAAGDMIDNQRGMSIARLLIPQLGEQGSISGMFLFQFAMVIYLALDGHLAFLDAFFSSFQTLPVLEFPSAEPSFLALIDLFITITAEVLFLAVQMAAPVIIAIFMADIILGIANRIAPQINVWELGFNIKGYVGILLLFVSILMIGDQVQRYTAHGPEFTRQIVEMLHGRVPQPRFQPLPPEEGLPQPDQGAPPVRTLE